MTPRHPLGFLFGALLWVAAGAAGAADRPYVGLQVHGMDAHIAAALGIGGPAAALVRDVDLEGPAALGGVRRGDVIVSLDGRTLGSFQDLVAAFGALDPGQAIKVGVWRTGGVTVLPLTVAAFPPARGVDRRAAGALPHLGLSMAAITRQARTDGAVAWATTGVLVTRAGKDATRTGGLARGDVIMQINQRPVWTPDQVLAAFAAAAKAKRDRVLVLVRGGDAEFRYILLPAR